MRKREIAESRRDGFANSSGDSVGDIDFLKDYTEALLSCPHANPKFLSETQMPGMQFCAVALKGRSQSLCDCRACMHPFLVPQPRIRRKLKNPSMRNLRGYSFLSGEVIVGQGNPVFQGGNA